MANSTNSLLASLEWAKKYIYNRQVSLGDFKEPLITASNLVKQTILSAPFRWRWNRTITGFVARIGVQDYRLGNWTASTTLPLNFYVVDTNANSQRVTTSGATGLSLPVWNPLVGGITTDTTVTWTNMGPIPNASSTYSFGWIENCSVQDPATSKWMEVSPRIDLALDSSQARPQNIAAELDTGDGSLTFRLLAVPDKAYPVAITVQQKATLFTSLNQTWGPLPDEWSFIYNWGLLSELFLFADDSRATWAAQKFMAHLLGMSEGLDSTARNIWLQNWSSITGTPLINQANAGQGVQVKGSY